MNSKTLNTHELGFYHTFAFHGRNLKRLVVYKVNLMYSRLYVLNLKFHNDLIIIYKEYELIYMCSVISLIKCTFPFLLHPKLYITSTRPCNILHYFTVAKMTILG